MKHYVVGIDLGTTNTVVAYAQLGGGAPGPVQLFAIDQLVAPGALAELAQLPSVRYHPAPGEIDPGQLELGLQLQDPGGVAQVVIGQLARTLGAQVPGRLVASAKSWLSHPQVDRLAPILPWGGAPDVPKVSPVAASASYLAYVRACWNRHYPASPLEQQELVLTVPASFDEAARALTLRAAQDAGLPTLRLLEEPQAVFYDWLLRHRASLAEQLAHSRLVLVCDVGGGTTDLSLIKVVLKDGAPELTRIGVGNHLMLGGDNMDLALAHLIEVRMADAAPGSPPARLSAGRMAQLIERCRAAKEVLLSADAPAQTQVTLLGAGARLIGASRSVTLSRAEVETLIVDGYFPRSAPDEALKQARGGIVEFGLPYARDPAVTRHIGAFLRQHAGAVREALGVSATDTLAIPDTLLLNGGVFRADALVRRLEQTLDGWRGAPLVRLHNDNPDVAVARGAVAYGLAQQGHAPAIGGGSARSYFLLADDAVKGASPPTRQGVCILPRGSQPGHELLLAERQFALRLGQPVRFHLYSALTDAPGQGAARLGELVDLNAGHYLRLPPVAMVLQGGVAAKAGKRAQDVVVQLASALTEAGTLEVHCVSQADPNQRWLLAFDLRHDGTDDAVATDDAQAAQAARLALALDKIDRIFGPKSQQVAAKDVKQLRAQLEQVLGERATWPTPLLRQLFDALWQRARGRRRSLEHERLWFNLTGFCLRPGFGYALDEWRLQQLWTLFESGLQHAADKQACAEWWTLWRRVAGGLAAPEQLRLLNDFAFNLQANEQGAFDKASGVVPGSDADMLRLGASLERIPVAYKEEIGAWLLARIAKAGVAGGKRAPADAANEAANLWALGRIGARQPLHGHTHDVVPAEVIESWLEAVLALDWRRVEAAAFCAACLARMTDDRTRDLPLALRERIIARLAAIAAPPIWLTMVRETVQLDEATERRVLGEALPPGLTLLA